MTRKTLGIVLAAGIAVLTMLAVMRRGPERPTTSGEPERHETSMPSERSMIGDASSPSPATDAIPDAAGRSVTMQTGTQPPAAALGLDPGSGTGFGPDVADGPLPVDDDPASDAPAGPPMDGPPPGPPSLAGEMNQLMLQIKEGGGPPLTEHAEEMLASDDPLMRAVGAALYGTEGPLPEEILNLLANDEDLQVPLMALGWLEDTGKTDQAVALAGLIQARGVTAADLAALMADGQLDSIAARATLDLLRNELSAADLAVLLGDTATGLDQDHAVRMKSLLLLRDTMDFETYRDEVTRIAETTRGVDPLWDESLRRLINSLEGPLEVLDRAPFLDPSAIDEWVAREYPAMLDDLALNLEYVLEHEGGAAAAGTADTLIRYADVFAGRPWTVDQQFSLTRLQALIEDIRALEEATKSSVVVDRPF